MKLLFVHGEEKLKEDTDGNYYTDGSYNQDVWDRYLNISDNLTAMFRKDSCTYETDYAKQKFQFFDKKKINFRYIPNVNSSIFSYFDLKKRKNISKKIKEALKENDCLIVRLPNKEGNIAIKYAKKYKKPYLIEVVGCPWDSLSNHSIKGKLLAPIYYLSMRKAVQKSPFTIYVTSKFLQKRYPCKGKVIGCSDVSLPSFDANVLKRRIDKIKRMDASKPIILATTGVVDVSYKGQEYVIKAISKLNEEGYNFEYHLIGGGDTNYLKNIAEKYNVDDKVIFLGSLPKKEVFYYLDNIDIYIQPSKTEGLPRALIEAMSRGCPSIGSKVGGIPELLSDKFVFQKASINEICDLLKVMNRDTMINEAERSFEKAKEYDKELLDKRRNKFYMEFLDYVKVYCNEV